MKMFFKQCVVTSTVVIAMMVSGGVQPLRAQSVSSTGGSLGIQFDPMLSTSLQGQGINFKIISTSASFNQASRFAILNGNLDQTSASGEIFTEGGITVMNGQKKIQLQNFILDTSGSTPVVSASYYIDGKLLGRELFLNITTPNPLGSELLPGIVTVTGVQSSLSNYFVNLINIQFKTNILTSNSGVYTIDIISKLTAKDANGCVDPGLCVSK